MTQQWKEVGVMSDLGGLVIALLLVSVALVPIMAGGYREKKARRGSAAT